MVNWLKSLFRTATKKPNHLRRGEIGEKMARDFLSKSTPLKVLLTNWRQGRYELDIICQEKDQLVFIEVRTRASTALVSGYHSIGVKKRQQLRRGAFAYMKTLKKRPRSYRFDAVEVAISDKKLEHIRHYKNLNIF